VTADEHQCSVTRICRVDAIRLFVLNHVGSMDGLGMRQEVRAVGSVLEVAADRVAAATTARLIPRHLLGALLLMGNQALPGSTFAGMPGKVLRAVALQTLLLARASVAIPPTAPCARAADLSVWILRNNTKLDAAWDNVTADEHQCSVTRICRVDAIRLFVLNHVGSMDGLGMRQEVRAVGSVLEVAADRVAAATTAGLIPRHRLQTDFLTGNQALPGSPPIGVPGKVLRAVAFQSLLLARANVEVPQATT